MERDAARKAAANASGRKYALGCGGLIAAVVAFVVLGSVLGSDDDEDQDAGPPTDPLDQMSVAFVGNPSKTEIQRKLDAAFAATGTAQTSENYSRAGGTLVALRRENGSNEMRVLDCIPTKVGDPRLPERTFPNVAALCSLTTTGAAPN